MAAEIIPISTEDLSTQIYGNQDTSLIPTFEINTSLVTDSYIELYIYDLNQNILSTEYNFTQYTVLNDGQSAGTGNELSQIEIDPEQTLLNSGYNTGEYITYFNFLNKKIGSDIELLYIAEISADRTEVRLDSTSLTNPDIIEKTNAFIQERNDSTYFLDFYLNFGDNNLIIANNILLADADTDNPTILVKLYEPLSEEFDLNSTLWVVTSLEEPVAYQVIFEEEPIVIQDTVSIKGPNFNLDLKDQVNNSTAELSYIDLITTSLTSSQNQLNSLLEEKEIDINVDYTNFSDFIHFSSAKARLENFYYKIELIEQYNASIYNLDNTISSNVAISESKAILEAKINNIITNFDGYDYYLYYSTGSWAWPKTTTEQPYQLALSNSPAVLSWFGSTNEYSPYYGGIITSASFYDNENKDNLKFSIPEFLRDDPDNAPYELFIDMVAQHFDNIWIYYKDVSEKYDADNRLEYGISKDLVADAIRDFGVKLYQNNFSNQDLFRAFLGLTPEGALFPFPEITGSLPTPTGFEYVNTLISASNDYLPLDDVNKSLYKRIYHNLPYLLKAKGTLPGLRALITSYGIPDTILRINEYGGKDKVDSNDWDYWQNEFNYAYDNTAWTGTPNYIQTDWGLTPDWDITGLPSSVIFRFKPNELPTSSISYSQSLWTLDFGSGLVLTYTGSGYNSGSYSGSIIDPYYQYATLTFYPDANDLNTTASVYLPFFDGGWWSTMVTRDGNDFTLHAGNKIYEGGDNGTLLGFYTSSLINGNSIAWDNSTTSFFGYNFFCNLPGLNQPFLGSLQEIRYYNTVLSESVFKDYIMNPYSIEGNSLNSGPDELAFRASLGGELYTGSVSIHPKSTGSWATTSSFAISNNDFYFDQTPTFIPNTEYFFYDQPVAGIKNTVSDKIRLENDSLPTGSTLSPIRALSQTIAASASYTPNINYLEVAFSPQNEINEDIMDQLGFFNIGEYIGDPAFRSSQLQSYPNLDNLRNAYFEKYTKNYDLVDFVRLIKFFDNSLFKMIKDFVPARTSLASGIVIKQHLLERNRYPQPQVEWEDLDISGTLKPQWNDYNPGTVENFSGGTGGSFEIFNGTFTSPSGSEGLGPDNIFSITQSWYETYQTLSGSVTVLHDSQEEFYDGEFSGSVILVTDQTLNPSYPLENASFEYTPILYSNALYNTGSFNTLVEGQFLSSVTVPYQGEILIMVPRWRLVPPSLSVARREAFIKIHKFDANGVNNSIPLGQLTNLLIKYTNDISYTNYTILNISEFQTYYLYEIEKQDIPFPSGAGIDNEVKDYYISSSITSSYLLSQSLAPQITPNVQTLTGWDTPLGNTLGYFNPSSGYYTLQNTPNIPIQITASIVTSGSAGTFRLMLLRQGDYSTLTFDSFNAGSNISTTLTASYYGLNGDRLYLRAYRGIVGTSTTLKSGSLLITQSVAPTASVQDSVIFEPYITTANFYNSDENALLNSVEDARLSTIYQDIDYTTGILTPTNFGLLISGSALKAPVQDSNYSSKRNTIPRYEGSRTTSQLLNKWSNTDTGTYGKLPTIESSRTYVAYSETIGGYAPERMNTSGVNIKYLISEDGDLIAPNTTPNALSIVQQNFVSGENVKLESLGGGTTAVNPLLSVFKGGSSIEPIIYNQIKHYEDPVMTFATEIEFTDKNAASTSSVNDFTATLSPAGGASTLYSVSLGSYSGIFMDEILASGSALPSSALPSGQNRYVITQDLIDENVDLIIQAKLFCENTDLDVIGTVYAKIIKASPYTSPTVIDVSSAQGGNIGDASYNSNGNIVNGKKTIEFDFVIPKENLQLNDGYLIAMIAGQDTIYYTGESFFKISTNPYPTPPISTVGLWQYLPGAPNVIYTTSSQLIQYLSSANLYQKDIAGSGFNPIVLPFTIERGDEFRFMGDETKTFTVYTAEVFPPNLLVLLDRPISGSGIDLNQFLLRRYPNNAGGMLLNGLKPSGFQSPYLIKPEYMSDKLKNNISKYIEDFTQKGLL